MSLNEEVFLKELKYDDTILDILTEDKKALHKIKIVNHECKDWFKNKKKYKHLKSKCDKTK